MLGSLAALTSRAAVFIGVAVLATATALLSLRPEDVNVRIPAPGALWRAGRNQTFLAGLGLMIVPAFLIGTILVLGPLHLSARGWGAAAIGAVWLVTAIIQSSISPVLGRLSDQRGAITPVVLLLALGQHSRSPAVMGQPIIYAILLVAAGCAYGGLYAPAFALPTSGGAVAQATGDRVPLFLLAALCTATLVSRGAAADPPE